VLAKHRNTPDDVLAMLLAEDDVRSVVIIAQRETLLPEFIERLSHHASVEVRGEISLRTDASAAVRERLTKDPAARKKLGRE
jgi:hypothetical protein